ncbi:hypothetical protein [Nocardia sp. NPDC004711]
MSGNRSRQSWKLSYALTERTGVEVRIEYHGARRDSYGGWHIQWGDGPTAETMRGHVATLAGQYPAIASAHLEYVRGYTDHSQAVALLLWLNANPREIPFLSRWSVIEAHNQTDYPGPAEEKWQQRGRALQALGSSSGMVTRGPSTHSDGTSASTGSRQWSGSTVSPRMVDG